MKNKTNCYKIVGTITAFIYFLGVIISIFSVDKFEFYNTIIKVGLLLFTPAIFLLFNGISEIISLLKELLTNVEDSYEYCDDETDTDLNNEEEQEDIEVENEDNEEKDTTSVENEESSDDEDSETEQTKYEPVIKDGKIQCRYCGKFNKMKRTYCYLCAKKLRD